MKILTWRERHKPGIRAATDPTIAELMQAEIDELRAALKAQPVQPAPIDAEFPELPRPDRNAWPHGFHDLYTAQQMRDYTQQATAPILAKLATQVALVEKCMVAMNENADRGEKAEAELAKLKAQPVQEPIAILHDDGYWTRINTPAGRAFADKRPLSPTKVYAAPVQPVQPAPLSDRHAAELKALSMLLRNMEGPVTLSVKKIAIAEAIEAAVRTGGAG